jgi:hypothetical protein
MSFWKTMEKKIMSPFVKGSLQKYNAFWSFSCVGIPIVQKRKVLSIIFKFPISKASIFAY